MNNHKITLKDINDAHNVFEAHESRNLFYRAATELVESALNGKSKLTVAEALAVLLQTWNRAYYQYRKFDDDHFKSIDELWEKHQNTLAEYRKRMIDNVNRNEQATITSLFQYFEKILGPVGAAKSLHLLAPGFFPLWDRAIATQYQLRLGRAGSNGDCYWRFMLITKQQFIDLNSQEPELKNLLKLIDEYNYCKYTKGWMS